MMIEPLSFGFNAETSVNNHFQKRLLLTAEDAQKAALREFNKMVEQLRSNDIQVFVVKDTALPVKPDAVFPNNWISFHCDGQVVLYPMFASNRRAERRNDISDYLSAQGFEIKNVDDFSFWEEQNKFLEGTGSMVLDRVNRVAYAALSERTNKDVFLQFCKVFEYKPLYFNAYQTVGKQRLSVYHTNVVMSIGDEFAVVCIDSIDNEQERNSVLDALKQSGREVVLISEKQMFAFAGNVLQVENKQKKHFLVMSQTAFQSFGKEQLKTLEKYNELIVCDVDTIEQVGGGSVRCMMAEIFCGMEK